MTMQNIDRRTVDGFGDEWAKFDQSPVSAREMAEIFDDYFANFPWDTLPDDAEGFDAGCGSGRWAALVAPRVGKLHCIDASDQALGVARRNLAHLANCAFGHSSVQEMPMADNTMDFGYSLGVLHHVPDTAAALQACARKLKPGAPFLLYLYYAFDNRPIWFRAIWRISDLLRHAIYRLPKRVLTPLTDVIAACVYWPLARLSGLLEKTGVNVDTIPLSYYRTLSFYSMRTDARDRFGTGLEQRFTKAEITELMENAGFEEVRFSEKAPFWVAVGRRPR
jgi:ubiquinone/menaquinone biosynthesis C-methylase UbiE